MSRRAMLAAGDALSIVDTQWAIDVASGLMLNEHRQSWLVAPGSDVRTLVEERERVVELAR